MGGAASSERLARGAERFVPTLAAFVPLRESPIGLALCLLLAVHC
jgi:hypothetical protein